MEVVLAVIAVAAAIFAFYFAFDGSRNSRLAEDLESDNADLRLRISELVAEVRRLREASGLPNDPIVQSPEDELMPLRQVERGTRRSQPTRTAANMGTVVVVSSDTKEQGRLANALSANGYRIVSTTLAEVTRYAHEISTAAILFDLRDVAVHAEAPALMNAFAADTLAKEVPLFALVATSVERERLIDDSSYTSAFVVPADTALLVSTLGAANIRRKTRARRSEAARSLSSALARS